VLGKSAAQLGPRLGFNTALKAVRLADEIHYGVDSHEDGGHGPPCRMRPPQTQGGDVPAVFCVGLQRRLALREIHYDNQ
jgi:hypothetical protein